MVKMSNKKLENEAADFDLDNDDQCPDKQTNFYKFKEYDTLISLIEKLPENLKSLREKERSCEHFLLICDTYQEQPHLVDPFLQEIFEKLIKIVKSNMSESANDELINEAFKYMYFLTKMRGYKKIVQHMPHENVDFEPVLNLLARQSLDDVFTWQTRYMLLIWLSIVCMVPFDLTRFDLVDENESNTIMQRLLAVCMVKLYLNTTALFFEILNTFC